MATQRQRVQCVSRSRPRTPSQEIDQLRARALRGDRLKELADTRREWILRSLLKGVRIEQAMALAGLSKSELEPALEQVRRTYQQRLDRHKQSQPDRAPHKRVSSEPQIAEPSNRGRGWWLFHRS